MNSVLRASALESNRVWIKGHEELCKEAAQLHVIVSDREYTQADELLSLYVDLAVVKVGMREMIPSRKTVTGEYRQLYSAMLALETRLFDMFTRQADYKKTYEKIEMLNKIGGE